jgi:hypothetical protein
MRDTALLGRQTNCPDCHQPMVIVAGGINGVAAMAPSEPSPHDARIPAAARGGLRLGAPAVAGLAAVAGAALGVAYALWPSGDSQSPTPALAASDQSQAAPASIGAPLDGQSSATDDELEARMQQLGREVAAYVARNGYFPPGTVPQTGVALDERFSWLAALTTDAQTPQPNWEHPWWSPLNERFVRRDTTQFRNPLVEQLVGPDGYPATHFVGVAGVGSDAASLPVDHERAGIFGFDRVTRRDDVRDGSANTLLIAGVQQNIGPWVAGGASTIRPFTTEPYVNGPDGFGTGQSDSMLVVMADGSVRSISTQVDPAVIRRLAAMSDESQRAEPIPIVADTGDADATSPSTDPQPVTPPPETATAAPEPTLPSQSASTEPAPEPAVEREPDGADDDDPPQPIDVAAALAQPIAAYRVPEPTELRILLGEIEEMAGVPILPGPDNADWSDAVFDKAVAVQLRGTTVGEVLQVVLAEAGLAFAIEADTIRIVPAAEGS